MQDETLAKRITDLENKAAIKHLVDTFSILADQKDTQAQTLLFTEDATSETFLNGQSVSALRGRKQLGEAFASFLSQFETVYHLNGQHTAELHGAAATGITYCLVTLIGVENGQQLKTTFGVYYHDDFVQQDGKWLIAKRKATFAWQDKQALGQ